MGVVVRVADHEPIHVRIPEQSSRVTITAHRASHTSPPVTSPTNVYTGPTEFTPSYAEQIAETNGKLMRSDLTIKEIPVYKTKNATGGYTIYVAERIND